MGVLVEIVQPNVLFLHKDSFESKKLMPRQDLPRGGKLGCMSAFRIAGVIPARLSSTRLSRKVLRNLHGRPMVEWVWRAAVASGLMDPVVVAALKAAVATKGSSRFDPSRARTGVPAN